ncbi:MAG: hypothetical protein AAF393_17770 [Pseudomonadota bacterium]
MIRTLAVISLLASPVAAEDWVKITDEAGVLAALDDKALQYETAKQFFYRSGKTLYDAGRPSWGNWRPQGAQYCSEWPPNGGWACYDLYLSPDGTQVRFIGQGGDVSDGSYFEWTPPEKALAPVRVPRQPKPQLIKCNFSEEIAAAEDDCIAD